MEPIVAVDVPMVGDERHKQWAKVVTEVDTTKSSGWAFVGEFIACGGIQDVAVGSVILVYGERGSRARPRPEAALFMVNGDGTTTPHDTASGQAWARTLRDTVARLLDEDTAVEPDPGILGSYSDQALAMELNRRGWTVTAPETSS
ncbi:MAG: hypothetical protein GEU79_06910 [Acidimicrobiia bacterium]|nr:hypothetical protein [Acidimicrobiia bacterium]